MTRLLCMCGAADCPSCGPAQGFEFVWRNGRLVPVEDVEEEEGILDYLDEDPTYLHPDEPQ